MDLGPYIEYITDWRSVWDEFKQQLDQHLDKAPTFHDTGSIFSALENGDVSLWRIFDSGGVTKAFILTRVHENSTYRIGSIDLAIGTDLESWINVTQYLKSYFKDQGCNLMEVSGRKGWVKLLAQYGLKERSVTLTVEL